MVTWFISILRQGLAHASLKLAIYGRISNSWTSCIHPPLPSAGITQLWDTIHSYCFPHLYSWTMLLWMVLSKLWCEPVFSSFGHMPRSRHADSYLTGAFQITATFSISCVWGYQSFYLLTNICYLPLFWLLPL